MSGQSVFLKFCQVLCLALVAVPMALQAQTVQTFTSPGDGTFTVPENVSRITVEVWGGGGGGGSASRGFLGLGESAGGGGGGAYASATFAVTFGDAFTYRVGRGGQSSESGGDSFFGSSPILVRARGGAGGRNNERTGAAGGAVSNSIGDLVYAGGRGADAPSNSGGGGGGSAGTDSQGNAGSGRNGGSSVSAGGAGGTGGSNGSGAAGGNPGGGGGGAHCGFVSFCFSAAGGSGGDGQVRITYEFEPSVVLDHIRILHPGVGLTCQPSDLQVLACADSGCNDLYPDPVDLTLQPAGWMPAQSVTVTGSASLQFQRSNEETVTLGVSSVSPAPDSGTVCIAPDGSGSCDVTFRDVAFVFQMPDLVAGEENKAFSMSALETDENTGQCTALFAGETRTIEFGTSYLNPGPADREASFPTWINGNQVATDGVAQTGVAITFDGDGVARDIPIRYNDAGRNSLLARYEDVNQPDGGTLLIEGAGEYVSVPLGLCLIPEQQCTAADLSCSNTLPAGVPFSVTPRAYRDAPGVSDMSCADKPPAPSFAVGDVPVSHQLVFPGGGAEGDLLETTLDYGDGDQSLTLTEVGVFSINTEAVAGGYLGRDLPASDMAMTARMVPDQLVLTVANDGELSPECNGFVYTGKTFGWDSSGRPQLDIEALNGQTPRQRTVNYTHEDVIGQLPADRFEVSVPDADNVETLDDGAATPVPFRSEPDAALLSTGGRDSVTAGVVRYRFDGTDKFIYPKLSAAGRIRPFIPELTFLLQPMSDLDDVPVTGIDPAGEPIDPIAAFEVRYGRLSPQNVYGPENIEELTMPLQMEYWNGDRFVMSDDVPGCTDWSTANITSNTANHHNLVPANGTFDNGLGGPLVLKANGSEGEDTLVWGGVPDWKKDDLDGDGNLDDPTATATFGVYRGHDRVIYWRESTD